MASYAVEKYYVWGYAEDDASGDFLWAYHRTSTKYPESGRRMELGNSYMFSSEPDAPDQRVFTLSFETMKYFVNSSGVIDKTISAEINFAALEDFYISHKMWKTFTYNHPAYGTLNVKFNKPLEVPKGIPDGAGALEPFSIELVEIP